MRQLALVVVVACGCQPLPIEEVPRTELVKSPALGWTVDAVRDERGIPHIVGNNLTDVALAQGYLHAQDRMVQLDLLRHAALGTLAELGGELSPSLIDRDIDMRLHRLGPVAEAAFAELQASTAVEDRLIVEVLTRYAAGVNLYIEKLKAGDVSLAPQLAFTYDPQTTRPWTEVDSLAIGRLLSYQLSYTCDADIFRSAAEIALAMFEAATPSRKGIAKDLTRLQPLDPTYTLEGFWPGVPSSMASLSPLAQPEMLAVLEPHARDRGPSQASNNWVVGPSLTAGGNVLVANDPHLSLDNPTTFYLVHLVATGGGFPTDAMGASLPGVPGIVLGHNRRVAWGATVSNYDVCDVYRETIVPCSAPSQACAVWSGANVPLTTRVEKIGVGRFGTVSSTREVTIYEVPHHGPILPRLRANHTLEPLGSTELSIAYVGHDLTHEVRALIGAIRASTADEFFEHMEAHFKFGTFNWVAGDDSGRFGWNTTTRVPLRAAGAVPWKVLPGDGSAEWLGDVPEESIPKSMNPQKGYLVTANADPIGMTSTGDPLAIAPMVMGVPLYLGADYDAGTRVGRATKRIANAGKKLTLDDMSAIQADAVTEFGEWMTPTVLAAARALAMEVAQPGSTPALTSLAQTMSATAKAQLQTAIDTLAAWSFDTPSGTAAENPTAQQVIDSRATLLYNQWVAIFVRLALGDERGAIGGNAPGGGRLIVTMTIAPEKLAGGLSSTGDSIYFDDLSTPTVEGKQEIVARALVQALDRLTQRLGPDSDAWRWGRVHTLALEPLVPVDALRIPTSSESEGFPRHGDNGTVDVASHGLDPDNFTYGAGPNLRFACELRPGGRPLCRNALPGGQVLDPGSPHYRDLMELWRNNQAFEHLVEEPDVVASAKREHAATGLGRVRFEPGSP